MKHLPLILQLVLILAILGIYIDLRRSGILFGSDTTTVINRDSTFLPPITVNIPPSKPTVIYQPVPVELDTMAILQDYYANRIYRDSLVNDTVSIHLVETVNQNQVQSRSLTYQLKLPLQTVSEIHTTSKSRLVFGGLASYSTGTIDLSVAGGIVTKKGSVVFGAYSLDRVVTVGYLTRLGK